MKKITLSLFICLSINSMFAQMGNISQTTILPIDSATGKVVYEGVIKVDTVSKVELYKRAKDWIVRTMKSSDNNINLDDKDFSSITTTGNIMLPDIGSDWTVLFTERHLNFKFSIYFKEGRIKYIVENIIHSCMKKIKIPYGPYTNGIEDLQSLQKMNEKWRNETYVQVDTKIKNLIESLDIALRKKEQGDSDNW